MKHKQIRLIEKSLITIIYAHENFVYDLFDRSLCKQLKYVFKRWKLKIKLKR